MSVRTRVLGPLVALLAVAAIAPLSVSAAPAPSPARDAIAVGAPCALAANTEITVVNPVSPSRVNPLANDCEGAAGLDRPLTITSAGPGSLGTVTTDGTSLLYDPRGCSTGDDFVPYTITDGVTSKSGIAIVRVRRPSSSPVTDLPQAGFVANSTIGATVRLKVTWCGVTATGSSVKAYRLQQGTNGGSTFPTTLLSATTARSTTRNASPGTSYAWRVRTTDSKSRVGAYAASLTSRVTVLQESNAAISYSSGWSTASGSKYSGNKERYTSKAGATATATVTNVRAIAIVASRASGRGSYNVYVDGVKVTSSAISQRVRTAVWRRVQYVRNLTSGAGITHTVQVRAVGNGRIDLDAILTLSGKRDQAIGFTSSAPTGATYAGSSYPVAASASSGLPVALSIHSSSWAVCSLAAGIVTFHGIGTCRIDAMQSGDPTWNARTALQSFAVAPKPLTVSGITAGDRDYDGTTAASIATGGAVLEGAVPGEDVTLVTGAATGAFADAAAGDDKTVTVSGLTLAGADAGNYTLTPPTASASIAPLGLTVSFTAAPRPYDGTTDASITGCSVATPIGGDDVTCDHDDAAASFAGANAGDDITVTGSGFALAGADAGNYRIDDVSSTTADITKASQSITFTSTPPDPAELSDTYVPTAIASSGLEPVTISVDAVAAGICHITAGEVTMDGEGICVLNADQDGDGNYEAAQAQQSFGVGRQSQTIAFDLSGVTAAYGDAPVAISATATSGLTVELATQTPGVCSYAAGEVTILTAGLCTIRASQSGDPAWAPAPDVDRSFTVAQRAITVTALTDTKTADGTTDSDETPLITLGSLATGDIGTFSQAFDSAAVGTGKTLTPSGTVSNGVDVTSSYEITFVAVSTGVIGPGPADVTTSEVKATPPNVTANGVDTTTITVTLRDAFGNALIASGGTVALSADGGSIGTVTDNGNGTYTATYTSDTSPGDVTVSATLDGTPITDEAVIHQH